METLPDQPDQKETKKDPAQEERFRMAGEIFKKLPSMTAEYKVLIKHTGGLVTSSMVFAYNKGIQDTIKLLLKENNNG